MKSFSSDSKMVLTFLVVLTISTAAQCAQFVLKEGNGGTQDTVCTLRWNDNGLAMNFKDGGNDCDNDEARSGFLRHAAWGTLITVYDNPDGKKNDDWTEIKVKADLKNVNEDFLIHSFERSQKIVAGDGIIEIIHHHKNGLDGKISRMDVTVF